MSPYEALNVSPVALKVDDSEGSNVPGGQDGAQPDEFICGTRMSALPVSTIREKCCGGVPTVRLTK